MLELCLFIEANEWSLYTGNAWALPCLILCLHFLSTFAGNWLIFSVQVWSSNDDSCCSDIQSSVYKKSWVNVGPNEQTSFIFLSRIKSTSNNCVYWMSVAFDLTSDRIWLCEVQLEYCGKHCWMDGPQTAQRMYLRSFCLIQTWISYRCIIMVAQDFKVG